MSATGAGEKREERRKRRNGKLTTICETAMSVCIWKQGRDQNKGAKRYIDGEGWMAEEEGKGEVNEPRITQPHHTLFLVCFSSCPKRFGTGRYHFSTSRKSWTRERISEEGERAGGERRNALQGLEPSESPSRSSATHCSLLPRRFLGS
jgi:hypothetical protein